MPRKYVNTVWQCKEYDVWGNAKDGYEVNDVTRSWEVELRIPVTVNNAGTPQEFESAFPTDAQIREALGLRRIKLDLDGDDLNIYVNHATDGYPCGELYCTSHESLSPVRSARVQA